MGEEDEAEVHYDKAEKFSKLRELLAELRVHRDLGRTRLAEITLEKIFEVAGIKP